MVKRIRKKLWEPVHTFLLAEKGSVELWVLLVTVIGIIVTIFVVDTEFKRVQDTKHEIQEQLIMALQGAAKRIDFYEASEGKIVIENDFENQFENYLSEALLLDDILKPLNEKDFGITGEVIIDSFYVASPGHDDVVNYDFHDSGLVAIIQVPMKIEFLNVEMPFTIPIRAFSEIRN